MTETMVTQKRLVEYGKLHKEMPDFLSLDDVLGREVTVLALQWFEGSFGRYVVMTVQDGDKQVKVRTGASLVVDALEDAEFNQALPVLVTFTKRGRTYRFS